MPGRRWYSPAAKLLMRVTGTADARQAMVQQVHELLDEAEVKRPPVDLGMVASFQRIKQIQPTTMPQAGRLVPDRNDLIIQVNAKHTRGKQNFTAAHEIGHTLLPTYQASPSLIEDIAIGNYDESQEEEYLCDVAAAEIL